MIVSAVIAACPLLPSTSLAVPRTKFIRKRWLIFRIAIIWLHWVLELGVLLIQRTLYTEVAVMAPPYAVVTAMRVA